MEWMLILAYEIEPKALLGPFAEPITCRGKAVTCVASHLQKLDLLLHQESVLRLWVLASTTINLSEADLRYA